jgi:hypothetical protein
MPTYLFAEPVKNSIRLLEEGEKAPQRVEALTLGIATSLIGRALVSTSVGPTTWYRTPLGSSPSTSIAKMA